MSFSVTCPNCEAELTIPDEVEGKRIRCKACSEAFRAEPPAKKVEPLAKKAEPPANKKVAKPAPVANDDTDDEPTPPRKGPRQPKPIPVSAGVKGIAFGGGLALFLVGLLAASFAAGLLGGKKNSTDPKSTSNADTKDKGSSSGAIDVALTDLRLDRPPPAQAGVHFSFGAPEYNDAEGVVVLKYQFLNGRTIPHNYQWVFITVETCQVSEFSDRDEYGQLKIWYENGKRPRLQLWAGRFSDKHTDFRMAPRRVSQVIDIK